MKINKKSIIYISLVLAIASGLFIFWLTSITEHNQLVVEVESSLYLHKVRIDKGFYSINEDNDEKLLQWGLDKVVYSDRASENIETICGENDFLVVYDNEYYAIFRHFIPNDFYDGIPEPHTYKFIFNKMGDSLSLTLIIEGDAEEKIEKVMSKIANANNSIWGR